VPARRQDRCTDQSLYRAQPGGITLGEKELALPRTLRNKGVMASRQTG